jgi:hypothetical protein
MSPASRNPVTLGLTAVGLAVLGLAVLLYGTYMGVRDAHVVRHLFPTLTGDAVAAMAPAILLVVGLLAGAVLMLVGRDAGRAALVWLCGLGSAVTLVLFADHVLLLRNWEFGVWIGPPAWVGVLGVLVAMVALAGAIVILGAPAARQAFAAPAAEPASTAQAGTEPAGTEPAGRSGPPAPLRAAVSRFAVGGMLCLGGPALTIGHGLANGFLVGFARPGGFIILASTGAVVVAAAGACLAAWTAGRGRPNGAHLARIAGSLLLLLQLMFLYQAAGVAPIVLRGEGADSGLVLAGMLMLAAVVAGIASTLGGFAGLADPRSERFLRPASRPVRQGWQPWPAAAPRPADDPAPVGGYTVP